MAPVEQDTCACARVPRVPTMLAAINDGVSVVEIARTTNVSIKCVERRLRAELRNRWMALVQDYAHMETIVVLLMESAREGSRPAIDRLMKSPDPLDRGRPAFTDQGATTSVSCAHLLARSVATLEQAARTPARRQ